MQFGKHHSHGIVHLLYQSGIIQTGRGLFITVIIFLTI